MSTIQQVFVAFCILSTLGVFSLEMGQCALHWEIKKDRADCTNFGGAKYDCPLSSCTINNSAATTTKGQITFHRCAIYDTPFQHSLSTGWDLDVHAESFDAFYHAPPHGYQRGMSSPWLGQ
ncbi:uncharacterized protein MELLADRAFT_68012 [Melampsora larici-populina 98AG31]|uniref:Secreted protein n=1 Tax=Melampsora larici-populina (strain 98AG31 / pathotype 3-4-7) TaxID=747676 RepID=F4S593_MELLP|nr:uncharacterized protein MELLADRAFT_68012 [Melampsora larici-populina 98AG31]EGG00126.1 hypothetical protein MELLADRAFT_68012 [Melampsora larici-populina 98AG31]